MKQVKILLLVLIMAVASVPAMAQVKIGIINVDRVLNESNAGKDATAEINALGTEASSKLDPLRNEIMAIEKELSEQGSMLTDTAKRARLEVYQQKAAEYERMAQEYTNIVRNKEAELIQRIAPQIDAATKAVSDAGKYDIILKSVNVAYPGTAKDITDEVIKKFNETYKK